ncbi:[NiFe]-hydrogenase assembly chaperone HybE [Oryzibacter oryziterrae]|uniref:[NiFe]-hydrogenase assembly chaperone HybE n=1 Tax=Oryzibacter oryziterrae TaxID=2766474 RepID=UPI001F1DE4E0|nr:[NiFe]-hydrogenase assembly chaperone HybE [Oryzibacter oryziterrae]
MTAAAADDLDLGARLVRHWQATADQMRDLPVFNPHLGVHVTEVRRIAGWSAVVVATPWFMNLFAFPGTGSMLPAIGDWFRLPLPAGEVDAVSAALDGFGAYASVPIFSPMDEFSEQAAVADLADALLDSLLSVPPAPPATFDRTLDRRKLLFGLGGRESRA